MSVDRSLLDQLIAEPSDDRFLVYADQLQTRGDVRGELVALDLHARTTNTPRDQRATEIERDLSAQLTAMLDAFDGVRLTWERGFVFEAILSSALVPKIIERGWLEHEALANLKSIGIYDRSSRAEDTQPIDLLVRSSIAHTLERVAIGSAHHGLVEAEKLSALFDGVPKLRLLELRAVELLHDERMLALERFERLESLALWTPGNDATLERLIEAPWPRLTAFAANGRGPGRGSAGRDLPAFMVRLLDGTKHPGLDQLALMNCGFEVALITELPRRPLGKRLCGLGLNWRLIDEGHLQAVREDFKDIELIWPRPVGDKPTADDEYQMSIRLRLGMDRDRKALPHALRACELGPDDHFHWVELGFVHGELDQLSEKLAAMDRAIELSRERWGGWAGRGAALRDLGRFAEARVAYETGLALDPKRGRLHYELGLVLARTGPYEAALAAFERTVEHAAPENRAWYLGSIAQLQLEHGRLADVAATLARARQLGPPGFRIARLTGYERLYVGAPSEALAIATGITGPAHREDELSTLALRAAALRDLDRGDEAAAIYHQIVDETDCPAWIAFAWLGLALVGVEPPRVTATDPLELADAIASHINTRDKPPRVHDTVDRCNDRIRAALAAIATAAVAGRHDETHTRATAFGRYLAGPAPVKLVDWWIELAELVHTAARRHPAMADLLTTSYQVATGRQPPSALL